MSEQKPKANRLAASASPYLQQHAYNPVNWYPWGEEALSKASREDKPILLSIGYSACHWCHVMAHESFENELTASIMNDNFVCIKVDREERPDVDNIYMEAIHAMGLQGGWPLNVFLTPHQKPFYGGTYFPKAGWQQLLQSVANAFKENRKKLEESADKFTESIIVDEVSKYGLKEYHPGFDRKLIDNATGNLYDKLDFEYGGVKKAPKFPMPSIWFFLLRYYFISKEEKYLNILTLTLDKMAEGGIYDHLEGGFARYSVDDRWFAPHFEKMLYDNGQLLALFAEAYSLTKKTAYRNVIDQTIEWLTSNMLSPEGGFYSALDADSEGEEGKYYVWKMEELDRLLGENSEVIKSFFNVTDDGNWEKGNNILFNKGDLNLFLKDNDLIAEEWDNILAKCKRILLDVRNMRIRPGLDNKILAGWNGITLTGIVKAYNATGDDAILSLALSCGKFLRDHLINDEGKITRVLGSNISGVLEDYAFVTDGLINLYQADFDPEWIILAKRVTQYTMDHFYDKKNGMFFYADSNDQQLIARKKEIFDNVIPSSNSQIAENLRRLGLMLDKHEWTELGMEMVLQAKKFIQNDVQYMSNWACAYLSFVQPAVEIAILGEKLKPMGQALSSHYYPFKLIAGATNKDDTLSLLKNRGPVNAKTTIYVCFDKACKLPVHSVEEALKQLPGFEPTGT